MIPSVNYLKVPTQNKQKGTIFRKVPFFFKQNLCNREWSLTLLWKPLGVVTALVQAVSLLLCPLTEWWEEEADHRCKVPFSLCTVWQQHRYCWNCKCCYMLLSGCASGTHPCSPALLQHQNWLGRKKFYFFGWVYRFGRRGAGINLYCDITQPCPFWN